jgi:hypothetical protein
MTPAGIIRMSEAKHHIQQAWVAVVNHVKTLDKVDEVHAAWSDLTDMLEAYAKEARDRRDLHRSHDLLLTALKPDSQT